SIRYKGSPDRISKVLMPQSRICGNTWRTASAVPWNHSPLSGVCSAASTSTNPSANGEKRYVVAMCRLSDAELYCVNTNIRMTSELMQFEIGTSTKRYFPPNGTAGFERWAVSGNKRLPAPPPRITASKLCFKGIRDGARI